MSNIYLSPSSQTANKWTDGTTEAERMQAFSDLVKKGLKAKGHTVYGSDNSLSLDERIAASNKLSINAHVALHSNAGGGKGPEVYYYEGSTKGKSLASNIESKLKSLYGSSRGLKTGALKETKETNAVAALIEIAFHDNSSDVTWMKDNKQKIADAIVSGICNYL